MNQLSTPHAVMMIRPASFGYNAETASTNAFQHRPEIVEADKALFEFDRMVDLLRSHEIDVHVFDDTPEPAKPDAIFPNNWISFHPDGTVILYPMHAANRRTERRRELVDLLSAQYRVSQVIDLSGKESEEKYLEGTGSLVFDHDNRVMFAARSPRTNELLAQSVAALLRYKPIIFDAVDEHNLPIYHTNVLMTIGERFALICLDAITKEADQDLILDQLEANSKQIIAISFAQMRQFAGNVFEVNTHTGEKMVLMSDCAFKAMLPGQINAITKFSEILPIQVPTIERVGGGSVRCMVAGIYMPKLNK